MATVGLIAGTSLGGTSTSAAFTAAILKKSEARVKGPCRKFQVSKRCLDFSMSFFFHYMKMEMWLIMEKISWKIQKDG